jgi:hypothetical protein
MLRPLHPVTLRESPSEPLSTVGSQLEWFVAAAGTGQTIALVVAKDPEAAAVYYFRDGRRAFATYERLGRMNSQPLVVTISPGGSMLDPIAQLHGEATVGLCQLSWLAGLVRACSGSLNAPAANDVALVLEEARRPDPRARMPTS